MKVQFMKTGVRPVALILTSAFILMGYGCGSAVATKPEKTAPENVKVEEPVKPVENSINIENIKAGTAAEVLSRKQVPILCYHHIRDWKASDSKRAKDYIVPLGNFRDQLKMLADSGYHTVLPDQLFNYLNTGAELPSKPVMLTFDDTDLEQYTIAKAEMDKYGFKGVYFIMTVSLNRPNYMSREQVKDLSDKGHIIGSHTWDHHNVKQYKGDDWKTQIEKPTQQLNAITGEKVRYFAYPFGLWNKEAIPELKKRGFVAAFQLTEKPDQEDPLFTIRRMIVPGEWSASSMMKRMKGTF